jgi:hypothetical protein
MTKTDKREDYASAETYKDYISKFINEIDNVKFLRQIYTILHCRVKRNPKED